MKSACISSSSVMDRRGEEDGEGSSLFSPTQTLDHRRRGSSLFSPTQTLDHHRRLLSAPPPLPDPDPPTPIPDDGASNLKTPASPPPAAASTRTTNMRYIECMKNHAVGKGSHVVDGCREFMPSGEDGTMEALRCFVCNCHRNFHRQEVKGGGDAMHQQINHNINRSPLIGQYSQNLAPMATNHPNKSFAAPPAMVNFGGGDELSSEGLNAFQFTSGGGNAASGPSSKKRKMDEFPDVFGEVLQLLQLYKGDTGAGSHEIRANYPSSKRLKTSAHSELEAACSKAACSKAACSKAHLTFIKMCANIALDYYNDENVTRFELLEDETLDSYSFVDVSGSWIHCSFNAKEDSSINEFFAELQYVYPLGPAVTTCEILVEGETQVGCKNCKSVTHPVGYRGGFHGNIDHASNAMSDDVEKDSPATTLEYSDKAKANHKHNETLDYDNKKNDATVTIDHFVLKEPTYTPRAPTTYDEKVFCNYALDHYNKINGTKFAYVDDGLTHWNSFNRRLSSSWIHICFSASDASASDASAVKLFFAEMNYYRREATVTVCKILEGETKGGCELCILKCIIHPVVGYHVG